MDRRSFLKGLVATAAGVLVPGQVLAEPERRVWALDQTMTGDQYAHYIDDEKIRDFQHAHPEQPYLETGYSDVEFQTLNRIPISVTFRADAGYERVEPLVLQPNGKYTCTVPPGYWHLESAQFIVTPQNEAMYTVSFPA